MPRFTVYRLLPNPSEFAYFHAIPENERHQTTTRRLFDGTLVDPTWAPPPVRILYSDRKHWDLGPFRAMDALAATDEASIMMGKQFYNPGIQLIPFSYQNAKYWIINILDVVACLDEERSESDKARLWAIEHYVFRPDRFTRSLFKLPIHRSSAPYCVDDDKDPDWSFKTIYDRHGMNGLKFKLLWSGG
ncbi:MAG TPA: hypothetical protein VF624_11035 [Tepidisphaeraceae bacterium]|jgi:hypothetical protein